MKPPRLFALTLLLVAGLVLAACALPPQSQPEIMSPTALPFFSPTAPPTLPSVTPVTLALEPYTSPEGYTVLFPAGWEAVAGFIPAERVFAAPAGLQYGELIRSLGPGYSADLAEPVLAEELSRLALEGVQPQESGGRHVIDGAGWTGVWVDVALSIDETPVTMRVLALVTSESSAFALRFWSPLADWEQGGYEAAFATIIRDFVPAPPTVALTPTFEEVPLVTATPLPTVALRTVPLATAIYEAPAFTFYPPAGWQPEVGPDGTVTFRASADDAPAGLAVRVLRVNYAGGDLNALLDTHLRDVALAHPDAVFSDARIEETLPDEALRGLSTTYVIPLGTDRLVYRATVLVDGEGTAFRLLQWGPESAYERDYRALFRAVMESFQTRPGAATQEQEDSDTP